VGVAKTIECRRGGLVCGARVTGETDDEVVRKAVDHARDKHGVDLAQSQTLMRYLRSLIREA
jgi:predicted small metal-binding protein